MTKGQQVKNSFLYSCEAAVSVILPLLALAIFTRIFTKEDYGALALAYVYAFSVAGIANFAMSISYDRNFFQYKDEKSISALLYSTLGFQITFALILGLITYIFKSYFSGWIIGSRRYANMLFLSYCSIVVINLNYFYLSYFRNTKNAKDNIKYKIMEAVLAIIFSLFIVIYLHSGIIGLVCGDLLASTAVFCVLTGKFLTFMKPCFSWPVLNDSLKICYPLSPRLFFKIIGNQFDKYLIRLLNTAGGVGIYSIGQKIAGIGFTFMTALENVFIPEVYKRMFSPDPKDSGTIGKYLTPFMYVSIAAALMISLFTEEAIYILTPKSYHGISNIAAVLSMSYGIMFFAKQPQLLFSKKIGMISFLTIFGIILNIGVNIPFIKTWGALGAAWATFLAGLIAAVISFLVYQHYYPIQWEYKKVVIIYAIFFGCSILAVILKKLEIHYGLRFFVKCLSVGLYAYAGIKFQILTKEIFSLIRKNVFFNET